MLSVRFELATSLPDGGVSREEACHDSFSAQGKARLSGSRRELTGDGPAGKGEKRTRETDACATEATAVEKQSEGSAKRQRLCVVSRPQRPPAMADTGEGSSLLRLLFRRKFTLHSGNESGTTAARRDTEPAETETRSWRLSDLTDAENVREADALSPDRGHDGIQGVAPTSAAFPERVNSRESFRNLLASWASLACHAPRWCGSRRRASSEKSPRSPSSRASVQASASASTGCRGRPARLSEPSSSQQRELQLRGLTADGSGLGRSEQQSSVREINASLFLDEDSQEEGVEPAVAAGRRGQVQSSTRPRDSQPVVRDALPVEGLPVGLPQLLVLLSISGSGAASLHLVVLPTCAVVLSFPLPATASPPSSSPPSSSPPSSSPPSRDWAARDPVWSPCRAAGKKGDRTCWEETYTEYLAQLDGDDRDEQHKLAGAAAVFDEETHEILLTIATCRAGVFVFSSRPASSSTSGAPSPCLCFSPVLCLLPRPHACAALAPEGKKGSVDSTSSAEGDPLAASEDTPRYLLLASIPRVPSSCVRVSSVSACSNAAERARLSLLGRNLGAETRDASVSQGKSVGSFFLSTALTCRNAFCAAWKPLVLYIHPAAWRVAGSSPRTGLASTLGTPEHERSADAPTEGERKTEREETRQFVVAPLWAPTARTPGTPSSREIPGKSREETADSGLPMAVPACATELHEALGTLAGAAGRGLAVSHILAAIPYIPFAAHGSPSSSPAAQASALRSADARVLAALAERQASVELAPQRCLEYGLWLVGRCADGRLAVLHAFVVRNISVSVRQRRLGSLAASPAADQERKKKRAPHWSCGFCRRTSAASGVYLHPEVQLVSSLGSFVCDGCRAAEVVYVSGLQPPAWQRVGEPGASMVSAHVCAETHALALVWLPRPECMRTLLCLQDNVFGEPLEGRGASRRLQPSFHMALFPVPLACLRSESRGARGKFSTLQREDASAAAATGAEDGAEEEKRIEADSARHARWIRGKAAAAGSPGIVAGVDLSALLTRQSPLCFPAVAVEEKTGAEKKDRKRAARREVATDERDRGKVAGEADEESEGEEPDPRRDLSLARGEAGESKEIEAILWGLLQPLTPGELRMKSQVGGQALRAIAQSAASVSPPSFLPSLASAASPVPASLRFLSFTYTPPSAATALLPVPQPPEQNGAGKETFQSPVRDDGESPHEGVTRAAARASKADDSFSAVSPRLFALPDNPGWLRCFSFTFALLGVCGDHARTPAPPPSDLSLPLSPASASSSSSARSWPFQDTCGVHTPRSVIGHECESDADSRASAAPDEHGRGAPSVHLERQHGGRARESEEFCLRDAANPAIDIETESGDSTGRPFCASPSLVSVSSDSWEGDSETNNEESGRQSPRSRATLWGTYTRGCEKAHRHRTAVMGEDDGGTEGVGKAGESLLVALVLHAEAEELAVRQGLERRALDIFTTPAVYCRPLQCLGLLPVHIRPSHPLVAFDVLATKGAVTLLPRERGGPFSTHAFDGENAYQVFEFGVQEPETVRPADAFGSQPETRATACCKSPCPAPLSTGSASAAGQSDRIQVYIHPTDQRLLHALLQVYVHRGEAAALQRVLLAPAAAGKRRLGKTAPRRSSVSESAGPRAEAWAFSDAFVLLVASWALSELDALLLLDAVPLGVTVSSSPSSSFPVLPDLLEAALRTVDLAEARREASGAARLETAKRFSARVAAHLASHASGAVRASTSQKEAACATRKATERDTKAWAWWRLMNPKQLCLLRGLEAVLSACLIRLTDMVSASSAPLLLSSTAPCLSWPRQPSFADSSTATSPSTSTFATPLPSPVWSPSSSFACSSHATRSSSSVPGSSKAAAGSVLDSSALPSSCAQGAGESQGERPVGDTQRRNAADDAALEGVVPLPALSAFFRRTVSALALLHAVFWWASRSPCPEGLVAGEADSDTWTVASRASPRRPAGKSSSRKETGRGTGWRDSRGAAHASSSRTGEAEQAEKGKRPWGEICVERRDRSARLDADLASAVHHLLGLSRFLALVSGDRESHEEGEAEALRSVPSFLQPLWLLAWPFEMRKTNRSTRKRESPPRDAHKKHLGDPTPRETAGEARPSEEDLRGCREGVFRYLFASLACSKASALGDSPLLAACSVLKREPRALARGRVHVSREPSEDRSCEGADSRESHALAALPVSPCDLTLDACTRLQFVDLLKEVVFGTDADGEDRGDDAASDDRVSLLRDAQRLFFPATLHLLGALPRRGLLGRRQLGTCGATPTQPREEEEEEEEEKEEKEARAEKEEKEEKEEEEEEREGAGVFEILALLCNSLLYFQQAINLYSWVCRRATRCSVSSASAFPSSSPPLVNVILSYLLLLSSEASRVALATSHIPLSAMSLSRLSSPLSSDPSPLRPLSSPSRPSASSPSSPSASASPVSSPSSLSSSLSSSVRSCASVRRLQGLRTLAVKKAGVAAEKTGRSLWEKNERTVESLLANAQLRRAVRCSVLADLLAASPFLLPKEPTQRRTPVFSLSSASQRLPASHHLRAEFKPRHRDAEEAQKDTKDAGKRREERADKEEEDARSLLHGRDVVRLHVLLSRLENETEAEMCERASGRFARSVYPEGSGASRRTKSLGAFPNTLSALAQLGALFVSFSPTPHAPADEAPCRSSLVATHKHVSERPVSFTELVRVCRVRALSHLKGILLSLLSVLDSEQSLLSLSAAPSFFPLVAVPHLPAVSSLFFLSPVSAASVAGDSLLPSPFAAFSGARLSTSAAEAVRDANLRQAATLSLLLALRVPAMATARTVLSCLSSLWGSPVFSGNALSVAVEGAKEQTAGQSAHTTQRQKAGHETWPAFLRALLLGCLYTGTFPALLRHCVGDRTAAVPLPVVFAVLLELVRNALRPQAPLDASCPDDSGGAFCRRNPASTSARKDSPNAQSFAASCVPRPTSPGVFPPVQDKAEERLVLAAARAVMEMLVFCATYTRNPTAQQAELLCASPCGVALFAENGLEEKSENENVFIRAGEAFLKNVLRARILPENAVHSLRRLLSAS
ncbi:conserved hypothetical protein [Neospora caninum Liverpool]|uniref:Uncharacterized protein n=1 Tax=Neospora caninum (strain Liverpool) TaxID=572307 RepID=F0VAM6_NEOCL|nr:conserved hypothetical protein [Neospora caninum Liverpool]CBZ50781.1 conserved hypothetical protein [Neospora caninum Liverpool]|eukprot:XP_003880814.1 conserved hypothetical protein [Neospora caninum Liverpool]